MGTSFWEDIKRTVKSGYHVAAEKTKEYTKIGKLEIDILNLKRAIDKSMNELGKKTYQIYKSGKKADISEDSNVKKIVKKIDDFYSEIAAKEKEIKGIKKEEGKKKPTQNKSEPKKAKQAKSETKTSPEKGTKSTAAPKQKKTAKPAKSTKSTGSAK